MRNRSSTPRAIAIAAVLALPFSFAAAAALGEGTAIAAQKPKKGTGGKKAGKPAAKDTKPAKAEPAPAPVETPVPNVAPTAELRGPTRIDFDDRLIQGQTNKSGAVYLFDRKETGISSMVRRRKSFRSLTIGTVYDR